MQKGQAIPEADGSTNFSPKKSPLRTHTVCSVLVLSNIIV